MLMNAAQPGIRLLYIDANQPGAVPSKIGFLRLHIQVARPFRSRRPLFLPARFAHHGDACAAFRSRLRV